MTGSLRARLLLILGVSVVAAWLATAFFSYLDTRRLIDDVVDANLRQSAEVLLGLVRRLPDMPATGLVAETDASQPISYRIHARPTPQGQLATPPAGWRAGYRDAGEGDSRQRLYGAADDAGAFVEVAIRQDVRDSFAARVAVHILHPLWFAVPLLAGLIWAAVRWGLRPLDRLAKGVARRSAADLQPLSRETTPAEILPLVAALNALFARIAAGRERDRRFAADAAHELRTPLAAIKTHAQVAQQAPDLAQCRRAVEDVVAGADRAARLVEQLLALARLDHEASAESMAPLDLAVAARQAVASLAAPAAARDIDLGLDAPEAGDVRISGNADLIVVLIRNLVENALRHAPRGGHVDVELAPGAADVVLRVCDDGPGIAPELRARAFDRFFRIGGGAGPGSGLGLSIAAAIVERHGGRLELKDKPRGPGLCVEVALPRQAKA